MSKQLLIFIQSLNLDTYVNALTHCVYSKDIGNIFFACEQKMPNEQNDSIEFIEDIGKRVEELASDHPVYRKVMTLLPQFTEIESKIIWTSFLNPETSISGLKCKIELNSLSVDVTGCSKGLAIAVATSFVANNIPDIGHFELGKHVFSEKWGKKEKLYHDLVRDGKPYYYRYNDFSSDSTVIMINRQKHFDIAKQALVLLTSIKSGIERLADRETKKDLYKGLGGFIAVIALLVFFTRRYGWDFIEPLAYFLGMAIVVVGFVYFINYKKELTPSNMYEHRLHAHTNHYFSYLGFDRNEYQRIDQELTSE